jgi:hypothetical protein
LLQGLIVAFFDECVRCIVGGPASFIVRLAFILFFPACFGLFVLGARRVRNGKISEMTFVSVALLSLIFGPVVLLILTADQPAAYTPLVLHEGPFNWPAGCAKRQYRDGDEISIACHDYRNTVPSKLVFDHGFPGLIERTEHDYFRVGSEAVNFRCNGFTQRCTVRHAERNVFQ